MVLGRVRRTTGYIRSEKPKIFSEADGKALVCKTKEKWRNTYGLTRRNKSNFEQSFCLMSPRKSSANQLDLAEDQEEMTGYVRADVSKYARFRVEFWNMPTTKSISNQPWSYWGRPRRKARVYVRAEALKCGDFGRIKVHAECKTSANSQKQIQGKMRGYVRADMSK